MPNPRKPKGWRGESRRHALARCGIKTKTTRTQARNKRSLKLGKKLPPVKLVDDQTFAQEFKRLRDHNDPQNPKDVLAFFNENENVIFLSPRRNSRSLPHELGHYIYANNLTLKKKQEFQELQKMQGHTDDELNEKFSQKFAEFVVEPRNLTIKEVKYFTTLDDIPGRKQDGSLIIQFN